MEEDLSLSLELGGCFTKRKREKISEKEMTDNQRGAGKQTETETEKNLEAPLFMHLSLPLVLSEMKNSKSSCYLYVKSEVIINFNLYIWSYI